MATRPGEKAIPIWRRPISLFWQQMLMVKCDEYKRLSAKVENVLGNLAQVTARLLELFRSRAFLSQFCRFARISIVIVLGIVFCPQIRAQAPPRPQRRGDKTDTPQVSTTAADVARGKYIVENVAMCPQCHTPRDANGKVDRRYLLAGAPELFQPPRPDPNWPLIAPRIGGNPPASDQDLIKLLTTGIWTDGKPLRLPMMPFRMSESDAKAVVAYLKSVNPAH